MPDYISANLDESVAYFNQALAVEDNFDIVYRVVNFGGRKACIYFIDGFVKDEIMQKLMQNFGSMTPEQTPKNSYDMLKGFMPYIEVDLLRDKQQIIDNILSGVTCMLVDGYEDAIAIDCRTYPARGVGEPEKDKVMRGSRDGFVETLVFNTALIRRRIRSTDLTMEMYQAGRSSKTDIVLCFMKGRVDEKFLNVIRQRIQQIDVDALTMNQQSLAECLYKHHWFNPFPKFKFSERPDTAAASVLEGNLIVLVDTSPSAMILPTSIFDIVEEADDYYFPPITGTYLRFSRFLINIIALVLTPLFLLLTKHPDWIPGGFEFIMVKDTMNIPLIWQFLILELAIDGLRLAALNTPSMLSTPLSVTAGLVIGEFTVSSGWFNSEAMLYMAFVAIANYTQSSYELGYAIKFLRIISLILTWFFDVWGFAAGMLLAVLAIATNRTIAGKSYIYPLIPFNARRLFRHMFRISLPKSEKKKAQ